MSMAGVATGCMAGTKTSLFGYDKLWSQVKLFYENPTHYCIAGIPGCGKTTFVKEFLESYYKYKGVTDPLSEWVFFLNGDQDRGIHRVRESLLDFVRQPTKRSNVIRWVIVDDMDTFPELSQQALRRPMELYKHVTCFIFIGNHFSSLIPPLQSRCKFMPVDIIQIETIGKHLLQRAGIDLTRLSEKTLSWFAASSYGNIAEYCHHAKLISAYIKYMNEPLTDRICTELCSVPPYQDYLPFIQSFAANDLPAATKHLTSLWFKGFSFEDILECTQQTLTFFGIPSITNASLVIRWLIHSWAAYCQGCTSYYSLYTALVNTFEEQRKFSSIK
jgi:hypothetical protein